MGRVPKKLKTRLEHLLEEVLFETNGGKVFSTDKHKKAEQIKVLESIVELYDELSIVDSKTATQDVELLKAGIQTGTKDAELFYELYMQNMQESKMTKVRDTILKNTKIEASTDFDIETITYVAKSKTTKRRNPTKTYISTACHYSDRTVTRKSNVFMERFNEILRSYGFFVE